MSEDRLRPLWNDLGLGATADMTEYGRYGVARALLGLGRPAEAVPLLEQVVRWLEDRHLEWHESPQVREELAAAYDEVGREADAARLRAGRALAGNP